MVPSNPHMSVQARNMKLLLEAAKGTAKVIATATWSVELGQPTIYISVLTAAWSQLGGTHSNSLNVDRLAC